MCSIACQKDASLVCELCSPTLIDPIIRQPVVAEDFHLEGTHSFLKELLKVVLVHRLGPSRIKLFLRQHTIVERQTDTVIADGEHSDRVTIVAIDESKFRSRG
jgi:hypothetical protein